jgi:serine/threonine protein kinase
VPQVLSWIDGILSALEAVHGAGVTHRDIKPENVFLHRSSAEGPEQAKLLDFGAAKMVDAPMLERLTHEGELVGTPHYMAVDHFMGVEVDERADLWSVGVMLFEMLVGKRPFEAPNMLGIVSQLAAVDPPLAHTLRSELPAGLSHLIADALHKDRALRIATARDMRAQLRALALH